MLLQGLCKLLEQLQFDELLLGGACVACQRRLATDRAVHLPSPLQSQPMRRLRDFTTRAEPMFALYELTSLEGRTFLSKRAFLLSPAIGQYENCDEHIVPVRIVYRPTLKFVGSALKWLPKHLRLGSWREYPVQVDGYRMTRAGALFRLLWRGESLAATWKRRDIYFPT